METIRIEKNNLIETIAVDPEPVIQKPLIGIINEALRHGNDMKQDLLEAATTTLLMQKILHE